MSFGNLNKLIKKDLFFKLSKYSIVGLIGTIIDIVLLAFLVESLRFSLSWAVTISFIIAASHNFILNKIWTFKDKSKKYRRQYLKFITVSIFGFLITISLMYVLVRFLTIWYITSKIITSIVVMTFNFLGNKLWTFRRENTPKILSNFLYEFSIIVPAYNEENRIAPTLIKIKDFLTKNQINAEIIVVDDGSKDNTVKIVEAIKNSIKDISLISLAKNSGKGFAVKTGVEASLGEYILYTDADGATPIEELLSLTKHIKNNDIVVGSRYLNNTIVVSQPNHRQMISRIGHVLSSLIVSEIKDTQCGFKLLKHNIAKEIFSLSTIDRFGFDIEILAIAQLKKYQVAEIPVAWSHIKGSKINSFRDSVVTLKDLAIIKLNTLSGHYN